MTATYEAIATTTLTTTAADVTFSSISGSFTDLVLIARPTNNSGDSDLCIRFNSDTGTNYSSTLLYGGAALGSTRSSNLNRMRIGRVGVTTPMPNIINIQNYSNTTTNKTAISRSQNESGGTPYLVLTNVGLWRSTSAITSITIFSESGSLQSGNSFTLYGIKAE